MKYGLSPVVFETPGHDKAWIIRVTINACKDLLKSFFHSRTVSIDEALQLAAPISEDYQDVLQAVLSLPTKYRQVVYLHYYEGYTAPQISQLLGKNLNTIYTLLRRSKGMLKEKLGGDFYGE